MCGCEVVYSGYTLGQKDIAYSVVHKMYIQKMYIQKV